MAKTLKEKIEDAVKKAGVDAPNKPKRTPNHPDKSHIVVAVEGNKVKTIRFGQQGVKGSPPKKGESEADRKRRKAFKARHAKNIAKGKMSADDFAQFITDAFTSVLLFCDGVIYCFGAQGKDGRIMFTVLDNMFHNSGTIVWVKDSLVLGRGKYHTKYEPCWFGWNKSGATFTDDRTLTNVWECKRPKVSDLHPTMKPIEIIEMALNHNPKAKSVLDIFLGSGSTMVAAHQLSKKCYGMELDPKYCQVIIDRMLKLDPTIKVLKNGNPYIATNDKNKK